MRKGVWTLSLLLLSLTISYSQEINWLTWEEVEEKMHEQPKKIMVDVYTEWCGWCKKMDASTFQNPELIKYINENFYAIKFDAEYTGPITINNTEYNFVKAGRKGYHELAAKILRGKLSYPSLVFLDYNMKVIQPIPGYRDALTLDMILHYFHEDHHKTTPWKKYANKYEKKSSSIDSSAKGVQVQTVGN